MRRGSAVPSNQRKRAMVLRRWQPWALVLLVALAAIVTAGTWRGVEPHAPSRPVAPARLGAEPAAGPPGTAAVKVCVTRYGLCAAAAVRDGDPCACPHPLRGTVLGHVERVGGRPVRPGGRHWPRSDDEENPLYDWDTFVAP